MKSDTKGKIIEAAARLVLSSGISSFTLDATAKEAGVSKGGLLYHFPTKEHLLLAMVNALVGITEQGIAQVQKEDQQPGSWLRGFIEACLVREDPAVGSVGCLSVAYLTAAATDIALLKPMADRQAAWREELNNSGVDPALAHIIRLAADGLWINDALGLPVLDAEEREAVYQHLRAMTFPDQNPDQATAGSPLRYTEVFQPLDRSDGEILPSHRSTYPAIQTFADRECWGVSKTKHSGASEESRPVE